VSASDAVAEPEVVAVPAPPSVRRGRTAAALGRLGPWLELALMVALALTGAWAVQRWVVKPFHVPTGSMEPTLLVGDRVLVSRFLYRLSGPQRGDVAVFHPPLVEGATAGSDAVDGGVNYVKRIVGLPGEWVGGRDGQVWICPRSPAPRVAPSRSGCAALREPYVQGPQARFRFRQVPAGHYFMMGDNRSQSSDSREIGPIPRSSIVGPAFSIYWPPRRIAGLG
jgi:signal peptidase I